MVRVTLGGEVVAQRATNLSIIGLWDAGSLGVRVSVGGGGG